MTEASQPSDIVAAENAPGVAGTVVQETQPTVSVNAGTFVSEAEAVVEGAVGLISGTTVSSVIDSIMSGIEGAVFGIILAVLTVFMPQLVKLSMSDLLAIGNNFRLFLVAIGGGTPWGTALADMLTADWNETTSDAKTVGTDFAEAVATALEKYGVLPQGK